MSNDKVNWHLKAASIYKKEAALERFRRYLIGMGFRNETMELYSGRIGAFLDYAKCDEPNTSTADKYRDMLVDNGLSKAI